MRILFVCAFMNQHGGFESYVENLAAVALRAGHMAAVWTPYRVRRDATILRLAGVDFSSGQELWRRTVAGRLLHSLTRLRFLLRHRRRPAPLEEIDLTRGRSRRWVAGFWQHRGGELLGPFDVVHLVGKPKRFLVDAARCARELGKAVVYSEVAHVDELYAAEEGHRDFTGAANLCDLVLAYSQAQLAGIRKWFGYTGEGRVIEQSAYDGEARLLAIDRGARAGTIVLGSLCRLSPEKDLGLLLHAFAEAQRSLPDLTLRVAGTGALEDELRQLAHTLGLDDAVSFLGYVDDLVGFYSSIDAFVICSREEGGPITGVEAMAAGLPIVTTPVGAMPERLRDATEGIFYPIGARDELMAALVRLADDARLRRRLGARARERYREFCHSGTCEPQLQRAWEALRSEASC